ncbi:MAG: CRTAC1 family protein, partial [Verrucomicrobiae bacterium]|nr:CRTAC1 family protein [Verrucomicrobiae bacterium]
IPGLDPLFADSANGNFLYHKGADGRFQQVAGLEPPAMTVKRIGWSWGGCFADFNNDSFLDLYVMSGYFSAPQELASGLDLESNLWRTMVRADEQLSRASFRFSPEWRRTPPPDGQGPEIDARMVGVERRGDRIWVHSLHDRERNRLFANLGGRSFVDASGIAGLDNPADSRGFAVLDYDRDGWLDLALVNGNQPLFNLYHNEMRAAGVSGGVIAVRFVGGNDTAAPSKEYACRDGYGARVTVDLGDEQVGREHRCGEGWSSQHSPTMVVGIGDHRKAASVTVRWPSGLTARTGEIPEGTLLTVYEKAADSPTGTLFTSEPYRVNRVAGGTSVDRGSVFPVHTWDTGRRPAKVRAYITFATTSAAWTTGLPGLKRLKEMLEPEGIEILAVPVDPADDNQRLGEYARQWQPTARLVNIDVSQRGQVATAFADALGQEPPLPSTVITDEAGHILAAQPGVPGVSALRKCLPEGVEP